MGQFNGANFDAYAKAIRQRESSGDYTRVNQLGYTGAYQFGKPALIDASFMDKAGNWTGGRGFAQSGVDPSLPGMLIDAGFIDPTNPDTSPAGGLAGLIQDYLRNNPGANR
jgi:hypothetical protein